MDNCCRCGGIYRIGDKMITNRCEKCGKVLDKEKEKIFVKNDGIFRKEYCENCWSKLGK